MFNFVSQVVNFGTKALNCQKILIWFFSSEEGPDTYYNCWGNLRRCEAQLWYRDERIKLRWNEHLSWCKVL